MRTKNFNAYILINWKTGDMRLYKTKPSSDKVGPYGKVVGLDIQLQAPEIDVYEVAQQIDIPGEELQELLIEEVEMLEEEKEDPAGGKFL